MGFAAKLARSIHRKIVLVSALCVLATLGCKPRLEAPIDRVLSVRTQRVEVVARPRTASLIGEFRARYQNAMSFRINGRLEKRNVDVGDRVVVGDVLASLDSLQLFSDVTAAKAALRSSEAALFEATSSANRLEPLVKTKATSQAEFDDAKAAQLVAAGVVNIRKSALDTAQNQLSYTELRATASGVILERTAEKGQVVAAGQAVFVIASDGERDAVFDAFPKDTNDRPVEDQITVSLISNPSISTYGLIREIAPSVDKTKGTVRVKVGLPDPPSQMTLGAPVIGVARFRSVDVIQLPWTALSRQEGQASVWVVDPAANTVSQKKVNVDSFVAGTLLVSGGLAPGELVVTEGVQKLRPGQKVKTIESSRVEGTNP